MSEICHSCGGGNLLTDYGEGTIVCSDCGVVQCTNIIDEGAEWRFFDEDSGRQDPRRVGGTNNSLLPGQGLCTEIGGLRGLAQRNRYLINAGVDQALMKGYYDIKIVCHALGLRDDVEEHACMVFRLALESGKLKRKSRAALIAAIVFISCRKMGQRRDIADIHKVRDCKREDVMKCYKLVRQAVPICSTVKTPMHYVQRYADRLRFASSSVAIKVAEKVQSMGFLEGKSSKTIAAVCVLFAARVQGVPLRLSEVLTEAGITDGTFKSAYQLLTANQEEILNEVAPSA